MNTFSTGPWRLGKIEDGFRHIDAPNDKYAWSSFAMVVVQSEGHDDKLVDDVRGQANANLIVAAPDLYEALEGFNFRADQVLSGSADSLTVCIPIEVFRKASAALAKARGEA